MRSPTALWIVACFVALTVATVLAIHFGPAIVMGIAYPRWTPELTSESELIGSRIVRALEQHRVRKGTYPSSLDELVPTYLPVIEPPVAGDRRWGYQSRSSGYGFSLWFSVKNGLESYVFRSDTNAWRFAD